MLRWVLRKKGVTIDATGVFSMKKDLRKGAKAILLSEGDEEVAKVEFDKHGGKYCYRAYASGQMQRFKCLTKAMMWSRKTA